MRVLRKSKTAAVTVKQTPRVYESPVSHFCCPRQDFLAGFFGEDTGVIQRF